MGYRDDGDELQVEAWRRRMAARRHRAETIEVIQRESWWTRSAKYNVRLAVVAIVLAFAYAVASAEMESCAQPASHTDP